MMKLKLGKEIPGNISVTCKRFFNALILREIIEEKPPAKIGAKFGIDPPDPSGLTEAAGRYAFAVTGKRRLVEILNSSS